MKDTIGMIGLGNAGSALAHALSGKRPLVYETPQKRVLHVERALGMSLQQLDEDFLRYMRGIR